MNYKSDPLVCMGKTLYSLGNPLTQSFSLMSYISINLSSDFRVLLCVIKKDRLQFSDLFWQNCFVWWVPLSSTTTTDMLLKFKTLYCRLPFYLCLLHRFSLYWVPQEVCIVTINF